nr:tetratricopeptide repeat protein [Anaerolineae bacterium]
FLDEPETVISFFEQYQDKYKRTPDFKPLSRLMGIAKINPEKSELVAGALTTLGDWYNQQPGSEAKLHAIEAYRQVLTLDPFSRSIKDKLAETYVAYGNAYLEIYLLNRADTDQTRAAMAYLQAVKLAPDNTQVQQAILRAFQTTGDDEIRAALSQVAMSYEVAINQASDALSNYWELANIYQELGQSDEAIALYLKILERQPGDSSAHYYLGQIYQNQEKLSEALTHYNRALELKPDWFQIYQKQYDLYRHQNDLTNAVAVLHRAANQNPTAAWPHLELGKLYWNQASGKQ